MEESFTDKKRSRRSVDGEMDTLQGCLFCPKTYTNCQIAEYEQHILDWHKPQIKDDPELKKIRGDAKKFIAILKRYQQCPLESLKSSAEDGQDPDVIFVHVVRSSERCLQTTKEKLDTTTEFEGGDVYDDDSGGVMEVWEGGVREEVDSLEIAEDTGKKETPELFYTELSLDSETNIEDGGTERKPLFTTLEELLDSSWPRIPESTTKDESDDGLKNSLDYETPRRNVSLADESPPNVKLEKRKSEYNLRSTSQNDWSPWDETTVSWKGGELRKRYRSDYSGTSDGSEPVKKQKRQEKSEIVEKKKTRLVSHLKKRMGEDLETRSRILESALSVPDMTFLWKTYKIPKIQKQQSNSADSGWIIGRTSLNAQMTSTTEEEKRNDDTGATPSHAEGMKNYGNFAKSGIFSGQGISEQCGGFGWISNENKYSNQGGSEWGSGTEPQGLFPKGEGFGSAFKDAADGNFAKSGFSKQGNIEKCDGFGRAMNENKDSNRGRSGWGSGTKPQGAFEKRGGFVCAFKDGASGNFTKSENFSKQRNIEKGGGFGWAKNENKNSNRCGSGWDSGTKPQEAFEKRGGFGSAFKGGNFARSGFSGQRTNSGGFGSVSNGNKTYKECGSGWGSGNKQETGAFEKHGGFGSALKDGGGNFGRAGFSKQGNFEKCGGFGRASSGDKNSNQAESGWRAGNTPQGGFEKRGGFGSGFKDGNSGWDKAEWSSAGGFGKRMYGGKGDGEKNSFSAQKTGFGWTSNENNTSNRGGFSGRGSGNKSEEVFENGGGFGAGFKIGGSSSWDKAQWNSAGGFGQYGKANTEKSSSFKEKDGFGSTSNENKDSDNQQIGSGWHSASKSHGVLEKRGGFGSGWNNKAESGSAVGFEQYGKGVEEKSPFAEKANDVSGESRGGFGRVSSEGNKSRWESGFNKRGQFGWSIDKSSFNGERNAFGDGTCRHDVSARQNTEKRGGFGSAFNENKASNQGRSGWDSGNKQPGVFGKRGGFGVGFKDGGSGWDNTGRSSAGGFAQDGKVGEENSYFTDKGIDVFGEKRGGFGWISDKEKSSRSSVVRDSSRDSGIISPGSCSTDFLKSVEE